MELISLFNKLPFRDAWYSSAPRQTGSEPVHWKDKKSLLAQLR
jgi:hypothetical protein